MTRNKRHADHGRKRGDIVTRLFGKGSVALQIVVVSSRSCIIGRQKAVWTEAVVHLAKIGRTRQYIVARFVRIGAKVVAKPQFRVGFRHNLHQSIAPFVDTAPLSPVLSNCMTELIQGAGTLKRRDASATYDDHRLCGMAKSVSVLVPAAATNEHEMQPSTMVMIGRPRSQHDLSAPPCAVPYRVKRWSAVPRIDEDQNCDSRKSRSCSEHRNGTARDRTD
jgi:hypothetical protein